MNKREFHNLGDLEEVSNELARASKFPVFIDRGRDYDALPVERDDDGDWEVDGTPQPSATANVEPGSVAVWNNRENELAYMASPGYTLVQHRDVIDTARSVVNDTHGELDMGVVRDYGAQFDGTMVFGNLDEATVDVEDVVDTDDYVPPEGSVDPQGNARARDTLGLGMRLGNSFDGDKKIYATTMGYRYICQNWMVWGEEEIARSETAHFSDEDDQDFIQETLYDMFEDVVSEIFDIREDVGITIREAEEEEIPFEWVPGLLRERGFGQNYAKRITGRALTQSGTENGETTAWRLYNAATAELDHNRVDDIRLGTYNVQQGRASSLIEDEPAAPGDVMDTDDLTDYAVMP